MNLRALRYFTALTEHRHFRRAAEACGVSQPTMSSQIKRLEEELGVQLIERSSRRVMLTPIGEEILERAYRLLAEADAIVEAAQLNIDPALGAFRLGIIPSLGPYLLPHVIPTIRHHFPSLMLRLVESRGQDLLQQLDHGELDAAVMALPIDDDQVRWVELFEEPFVLAMPEGHPLAQHAEIKMEQLRDQPLLLLDDAQCLRPDMAAPMRQDCVGDQVDFKASSVETLRYMVAAGSGVTLLPVLAVRTPMSGLDNLVTRPFARPGPRRKVVMAWRKSAASAAFIETLAAHFQSLPNELLNAHQRLAASA
jgi:LysR family hydrogen peroxide-inducible transcriptional activator